MAFPLSHPTSAGFYAIYGSSQLDRPSSAILSLQELLRNAVSQDFPDMADANLNFTLDVVLSILNLIKFTIHDPADFSSITLQSLQEMQNNIASLEIRLCVVGSWTTVAEERSLRTKRCCQNILCAFEVCRQYPSGATNSNDVEQSWQSFHQELDALTSEPDQTAVSTLREIYHKRQVSSPSVLLPELYDFCTRLYNEEIIISAHNADTAGRTVMAIMQEIIHQLRSGVGSPAFFTEDICHELVFFLTNMVDLTCQSDNYQCLAAIRQFRLRFLFKTASEVELITIFRSADYLINQQIVANCPTSTLKQKLEQTESVAALIGCSEEGCCSICMEDNVTQVNFAILDKCNHLFCKECIATWFTNKATCPYCRTTTFSWTARDDFLAFKESRRLYGENSS